jgi:hypothetical protein
MMVKSILNQEEPWRGIIGIVLLAISVVTYLVVLAFSKRGTCPSDSTEPFANEESGTLGEIIGTIKRVSGVLLNPSTWTERIEMYSMTPAELARRYLKSQATVENDETD